MQEEKARLADQAQTAASEVSSLKSELQTAMVRLHFISKMHLPVFDIVCKPIGYVMLQSDAQKAWNWQLSISVCLQTGHKDALSQIEHQSSVNAELMKRKTEIEWQLVEAVATVSPCLCTASCPASWSQPSYEHVVFEHAACEVSAA